MPFYTNPVRAGTDAVSSFGDGTSINIKWFQAYPSNPNNKIAYNIYYSTVKKDVYSEGIKYVSFDGSLEANIIDLIPGQEYFLTVRPVEYNPNIFNLNILPLAYDNLRYYPFSILRQNISKTDLIIPLIDVSEFPSTGVIKIGSELIQYLAVDSLNKNLIVYGGSAATSAHLVDQGGGNYYTRASSNVGDGYLNNLTVVDGYAQTETWTVRCVGVQRNSSNVIIPNTAKFIAFGSISGQQYDGYANSIIWQSDGYTVSNGILSFAVTNGVPDLREGDTFIVKVAGIEPGIVGGRGYGNTIVRPHSVGGDDGYTVWDPTVILYTLGEDTRFDRIFACQSRFEYPNYQYTQADGYHQVLKDLLNTDLSAADADNVDFPQYDYSGYHRTDPVLLLNGTCVGSYIGGEQGCIDQYGNINMVRGLNLQDQNTQRQDVLLSVTGRPAVLIQSVNTGITCACYSPSSEYPDDRCPMCFVPGTLINTKDGFRPIEDIKIGDMVLSSDGEYHKVLNTFVNDYNGKLKSITTSTTTSPILCTPEHPFLSLGGNHNHSGGCGPKSSCKAYIERGDGRRSRDDIRQISSGKWSARAWPKNHERKSLGLFDTREEAQESVDNYLNEHYQPGHTIVWKNANELVKNNWLVNKWHRNIIDVQTIEIPQEFQKNTKLGSQRNGKTIFDLDEEFLWVIGLYIAEGSSGKRSITFALHKKEIEFQNRVINFFKKYNYNSKIYEGSENGIRLEINSTSLSQWFPKWLGHLCFNKKIPNELMNLPDNKARALIQGIFDGDACKRDLDLMQTSEILALQVAEILQRLGQQPNVRRIINNKLTPIGNKRRIVYGVSKELPTFNRKNRRHRWQFNENLLTKIKKIEDVDYSGKVYNLEVEGDHTYVVQNVVVHNCHGNKFVIGYQQYFNPRRSDGRILVRVGPTDETNKMYEAGLESEFPLSLWTLNVPSLKPRDVIVLFDQDDNEEFRYEISSVTRNNTILGLQGGQLFKVIRIRKFDPAYQIRIFRNTSEFPEKFNTSIASSPGILPHNHVLVTSEKVSSITQINQTTSVSQGHSHSVVAGVVQNILGHSHILVLP